MYELHCNPCSGASDDDYSDTEADSNTVCIDPKQPPVWSSIYGTTQLDNPLASKPIYEEYLDIFNSEMNLESLLSHEKEDQ